MHQLPRNVTHINRSFEKIKNVIQPLKDEIESPDEILLNHTTLVERRQYENNASYKMVISDSDEAESIRIQASYMAKIRRRCHTQIESGQKRCRKAFHSAHARCMDKLPAVVDTLLCWPMQVTVVCSVVLSKGGDICNPSAAIDPAMGHEYVELMQTMRMISAVQVNVSTTTGGRTALTRIQQYVREHFVILLTTN